MEEIFVIYENPNDYESGPDPVGFVLTKEEAETEVNKLTATYLNAQIFMADLYQKINKFRDANKPVLENSEDYPRWPAGTRQDQITPEMRKERDTIKGQNEMRLFRNNRKEEEYQEKEKEFVLPIYELFPPEIKKLFYFRDDKKLVMNIRHLETPVPYFFKSMSKFDFPKHEF